MKKTIELPAEQITGAHNLSRQVAVNSLLRELAAQADGTESCANVERPGIEITAYVSPRSGDDEELDEREMGLTADMTVLGRRIRFRMPAGRARDAVGVIRARGDDLRDGLMAAISQIPAEATDIVKHTPYRLAA
ncbi:hypothetical protein [Paracoccus sanguinis]|uniref:Uncharacterized protein n=1 Tax=Paracoccus sanguinis TaxID=1545044 RepID=A0A099GLM2_9RHOB|nr:hypothetical protein [Paracoccus sanguinis]KGJ23739.1 hypothetical protein IX56_00205 [Paracoccus sanguinis]